MTRTLPACFMALVIGSGSIRNALFALAVEAVNDLPPPSDFHDFHALTCLLYGHDPFQWEPDRGMDRAALISMALAEKIIPLDSYAQFLGNARQEQLGCGLRRNRAAGHRAHAGHDPGRRSLQYQHAGATCAPRRLRPVPSPPPCCAKCSLTAGSTPTSTRWVQSRAGITCRDLTCKGAEALRTAVEASPGHLLMEADVSQCELRVLAHFSQDPRLLDAFRDGNVDLHVQTAAAALGIAAEQVTNEQRGIGKQVNFAIVFGMAADSLAQRLGISPVEAQMLLDGYFAAYPGVRAWIAQVHAAGRTKIARYARSAVVVAGFLIFDSRDPGEVATAQRQAVNTIVQGMRGQPAQDGPGPPATTRCPTK